MYAGLIFSKVACLRPGKTLAMALAATMLLPMAPAVAEVRLAKLFADGMVLQRDMPINLWGTADTGEQVDIEFMREKVSVTADAQGRWSATLSPQPAGVDKRLKVSASNTVEIEDIALGDVWLASGQSNMAFQVRQALKMFPDETTAESYPDVRQFFVPRQHNFKQPQEDFAEGYWQKASRQTVGQFSAVAWFFAKDIADRYKTPVGIINASVGGTPVAAWMSEATLTAFPQTHALALQLKDDAVVEQYQRQKKAAEKNWQRQLDEKDLGMQADNKWYLPAYVTDYLARMGLPVARVNNKWYSRAYDDSDWQTVDMPGYWHNRGVKLANGAIWLRKTIRLSAAELPLGATLELGHIIDDDTTYVNGKMVGGTHSRYPARRYQLAPGVLQAGDNLIAIRIAAKHGVGGLVPAKPYQLLLRDKAIDLAGSWKYRIGAHTGGLERRAPVFYYPTGLFNAMIAPATKFPIKGVIWYQGEANTSQPREYADLFSNMIKDWRKRWQQDDLPFLFVQLANFMRPDEQPRESNWAALRQAQADVNSRVPNTAMAVTIDVGEWNDIHPLDKKTVGQRLALGARRTAYGETNINPSGPQLDTIEFADAKAILTFKNATTGLVAKDGALGGFSIAGEDGAHRWALAKIADNRVVVWHDEIKKPAHVRYAWSNNPAAANLYNKEGLPAIPFSTQWRLD